MLMLLASKRLPSNNIQITMLYIIIMNVIFIITILDFIFNNFNVHVHDSIDIDLSSLKISYVIYTFIISDIKAPKCQIP